MDAGETPPASNPIHFHPYYRQWFARLHSEVELQRFVQSKNDCSLFLHKSGLKISITAVYVDDIIFIGPNIPRIHDLKAHLHSVFSIKDLGPLSFFLGIEVSRLSHGIILSQRKFTNELLAECDLDVSRLAKTPLPLNLKLLAEDGASHYKKNWI